MLNNRIPDDLPAAGFEGDVYGALSTGNQGREAALRLSASHEKIALQAEGFARRTDDYDLPKGGQQADTFARTEGFSVGASHISADGYVGVSGGRYTSTYGIPAAEEPLFIDMRQTRLGVAGELGGVSFEGGWSSYVHDEVAEETGEIGSTFRNKEWETRAEYLHTGLFGTEGAFGVQAGHRNLTASGEGGELLSPAKAFDMAVFAFEEVALTKNLTAQLGARAEHVVREGFGVSPPRYDGVSLGQPIDDFGNARKARFTLLSASGGLIKALSETTQLSFNGQYAQRAPAIAELFSKGPHEATETFEIGAPDLKTEKALSGEVGVTHQTADMDLKLTAFYTQFQDFIFKRFTGFVCGEEFESCGMEGAPGVEDELTQIVFAQRDAHFYGLEAESQIWLATLHGAQLGVEGRFDMVRARLESGGNVPRIPPMRLGFGVIAEGDAWFARLNWRQVFRQSRVAVNETATKSYRDVNAQIVVTPQGGLLNGNVAIGLTGSNLLDRARRNHVSFKKQDVVLPGRQIRVFIRAAF